MGRTKWVSASPEYNSMFARFRHAVRRETANGWTDTECGSSGATDIMIVNAKKPKCPRCVSQLAPRNSNGQ